MSKSVVVEKQIILMHFPQGGPSASSEGQEVLDQVLIQETVVYTLKLT